MAQLKIHQFTDSASDSEQDYQINQSSLELLKANETRYLSKRLINRLEVSEERGVLLIPFRDGPIGALLTLHELIEEDKNIDNITPSYIKNPENYSQFEPWFDDEMKESPDIKKARPLSVSYEGGAGEVLLNSTRSVSDLSQRDDQIVANVRIQKTRLPSLQTTITDFKDDFIVDFGYMKDSGSQPSEVNFFPQSWDVGDTGELQSLSTALLRKLLHREDYFGNSPFRSVEQIRALLIARFHDTENPIKLVNIYDRLDDAYKRLDGVSGWDRKQRNKVTHSLLEGMREGNLLEKNVSGRKVSYNRGYEWDNYNNLFECYIDYYYTIDWEW